MADKTITTGILMDENNAISFIEVCEKYDISEALLEELIEHGLFTESELQIKKILFDAKKQTRIRSASRLHQDLGINTPGIVLALELLDEIETIRRELAILKRLKG